jgi:hypothetical protein
MGFPLRGLLKKAIGGAITAATGTASSRKQRGTAYAVLALVVSGVLVKFFGFEAEVASILTSNAIEQLP